MVNDLLSLYLLIMFPDLFFSLLSILQLNSPFLTPKLFFFSKWPCYYFLQAWRFSSSPWIFIYMNIYERIGLSSIFVPKNYQCFAVGIFHFISSKYCVTPFSIHKNASLPIAFMHLAKCFHIAVKYSILVRFSRRRKLSCFFSVAYE